ncbi:MAG TPA: alcohol dehydrogenase catalytic domain-containing protein [Vicinamibacteria bacterium]|nr:alcohol dehydrogenase catalytic domain-containing protein [Vicinamibacteria bacterium]
MKAAVYRGANDLRIEEIPVPEVERGEMLVRVDACGVCGTDIKKIHKGLLPGPRVFGHEIAGTVVRPGPGVSRFREGQRVVLHHHIPCGSCFYCGHAAYAQCEGYKRNGTTAGFEPAGGGFAEYVKALDWIVERGAIPVPDGVWPEEAIFVEPVNTCLKAVQKAEVRGGETVLVVGQGPIGLLLLQLARWAGARTIVSDVMPDRLEMSRHLGAEVALDATGDVPREVRALTGGRGADCAFLAAVGKPPFTQAVSATRPGGRIMVFAATSPGETAEVDLGALCAAEKEIRTSYSASVDVQDLAARLVFGREIRVRELVTHRLPLQEAAGAVELASRPAPGVLKVVLQDQTPAR